MKKISRSSVLFVGLICTLISTRAIFANDGQSIEPMKLANEPISLGGGPVQLGGSSQLGAPATLGSNSKPLAKPSKLTKGPVKLTNGPVSLTNGSVQLSGGPVSLTNGPVSLTNGPVKLTNGSVKLTNGSVNLGGGITMRNEGPCNHHLMIGTDTLFAFDKSDLSPTAEKTLNNLGAIIKKFGTHPLSVEGHTDGKGTEEYNQGLSERRASSVKDWLVAHSFATSQTPATGYGKKRPVAPNQHPDGSDNPAGRQLNRRVEVVVDTCH
jgi:outer membrane protein OmpA-like peptidoglycan-associated protein